MRCAPSLMLYTHAHAYTHVQMWRTIRKRDSPVCSSELNLKPDYCIFYSPELTYSTWICLLKARLLYTYICSCICLCVSACMCWCVLCNVFGGWQRNAARPQRTTTALVIYIADKSLCIVLHYLFFVTFTVFPVQRSIIFSQ